MTDQITHKINSKSKPSTPKQVVDSLPKHWEVKKLRDVCEKLSLNKIKIKQRDYLKEGKYPVVDQGQELIGGYYNDDTFVVPKEPPYIIFGDHTKVKKYINFKFVAGADGVKVLKSKANVDSKFLYYLVHAIKIDDKGYARHFQLLEKSDFPIPPLPEQQAIVAKIEELLSELDNGKQQLLTAQKQLKVYRQSLLKWAFEGKLCRNYDASYSDDDHDKFNHQENQGNQKNQKNHSSDKGKLPKGWKWVKLNEVSKVSGGLTKNSKRQDFEIQLPFLRVANVYFNYLNLNDIHKIGIKENEIERVILKKDDLLFVEGNGSIEQIGRVALWNGAIENCVHQNHLIKARLFDLVLPKFALYFFCSSNGRDKIKEQANSTSGLHTLNLSKISNLELPLPPFSEQQLIVSELENKLTICDKIEETISQSLLQVETLRQSILKQAFEGKLVTI